MAMIDTMSIMGIRSFGPADANQQVIKFQHPLTLIVGPNGAGKTTIIECLKYATTGEHPLNTKGGAFVHDPKLSHATEIKAKVRLKCKTVRGEDILVERGMVAEVKKNTTKFKTLDGVITKIVNEERKSITSKCADLNREMVSALGVSKAVLDNVIFCHQEESNWPLTEGKSVKQKFDDIFAATRYIKALDEIKQIQKGNKSKKDIEETQLKHLKANKIRASDIKSKLTFAEMKLNENRKSRVEAEEALGPIRTQIEDLSRKRMQIIQLDGELGALRSRKDQMIKDEGKLESRINNLFHGTDEQLQSLQKGQEEVLLQKKKKQSQCEKRIRPLQDEINNLSTTKINLSVEQGKLEQAEKNIVEKRKAQSQLIRQTVEDTGIHVSFAFKENLSPDDIEEFETAFYSFKSSELKVMKNRKIDLDKEMKQAEDDYQTSWKAKTEMVEANKHKSNALRDLNRKLAEAERELKRIQTSGSKVQLEDLQQQIVVAQRNLEEAQSMSDFDAYSKELSSMVKKKSKLDAEMESVDNDIMGSQKTAQIRTKVELLERERKTKEKNLGQLKAKAETPLSQLGLSTHASFPNKAQLNSWIQDKEEDLQQTQQEFNQKKSSLTKLSAELEMTSKQIKQKRTRYSELDETLFEVCGSQDLEQDMTSLESDIKKLQGKKGLTDGIQHMYRKFIADMTKDDVTDKKEVTCPLCQRLFDEPTEVDDLITSLEEKLEVAPKKLENQARDLEKKQTRYKLLQDNKPLKMELDRLNETELPDLERRSKQLSGQVGGLKKQSDSLETQCTQLRTDENTARNCVADVVSIDRLQVEIRDISKEISGLKNQLPVGSTKSIDDLQEQKKSLSATLSGLNKSIDQKKSEIERKKDNINDLKDKLNKAQEEKLQLASNLQKSEQLHEKRKTLSADIQSLKTDINENEAQLVPLSGRVEESLRSKSQVSRKRDEAINEMNRKKQELESKLAEIEAINRKIQNFDEAGIDQRLKRNANRIADLERKMQQDNDTLQQSHDEINKLEKELATCTDRQRDLEDNIALRERRNDINEVEKKVAAMEKKLDGMDVTKLRRESNKLEKQNDKLNEDRVAFKEKEVRYREETASLKKQLDEDEHRNAEELYRKCLVTCSVLELTSKDLDKYYKALDRAIMKYHQIKMEEINRIIKDLWRETYRGTDIDSIQICSDEDTGSNTTRRVFNYRVVMYVGGVGMDMRGRCSAGQKVLASLVIRLALAETFCINCGILALDEPTTNLDRDNIESLARSLVSIIDSRSCQRNFQLVVITHDEDFVDLLGRSKYVDDFYRINKDDCSLSRIYKCPIRELAS